MSVAVCLVHTKLIPVCVGGAALAAARGHVDVEHDTRMVCRSTLAASAEARRQDQDVVCVARIPRAFVCARARRRHEAQR